MGFEVRHPAPVVAGGHVRVISPSWPVLFHAPQRAKRADEFMQRLGLRVSYGTHAWQITDDGRSAGSAQLRAEDFMEAFTDPSVDVVFSAYGGDTAHELIPFLDAKQLRAERKAFIGNSDNVWLHQYLLQEADLTSYYGATYAGEIGEFGGPFPETADCLRRAVLSADDLECVPMYRRCNEFNSLVRPETEQRPRQLTVDGGWHWLRPGWGRGRVIGAELSALIGMADRFDLKLDGCILFWDVMTDHGDCVDAKLADLQDMLTGLADRGLLNGLVGMIVGPDIRIAPQAWAAAVDEILSAVVPTATYPVVVNADIGHLDPRWIVPYGRTAVLDSSQGLVYPRQSLSS